MKLITNAYVTSNGVYNEQGGLIIGSQRISNNHPDVYWQQSNIELTLSKDITKFKIKKTIPSVVFVGRIPRHFGHFIMEGLPRLCDVYKLNLPIICDIVTGNLPPDMRVLPVEDIKWVISCLTKKKIYKHPIKEEVYKVKNLYIPDLPFHLSHNCSEPERMKEMISKIISCVWKKHLKLPIKRIDNLYLIRDGEKLNKSLSKKYTIANTKAHISKQICDVSIADSLHGIIGSSTHISIFAHQNCLLRLTPRKHIQAVRNQAICDLVKSYNDYYPIYI